MKVITILLIVSILLFLGGATYAVISGAKQREDNADAAAQADEQICDAVIGLRTDLVQVLEEQKEDALKNVKKLGLDVKQYEENYEETIALISNRECP